jgi:hypothetical protein
MNTLVSGSIPTQDILCVQCLVFFASPIDFELSYRPPEEGGGGPAPPRPAPPSLSLCLELFLTNKI